MRALFNIFAAILGKPIHPFLWEDSIGSMERDPQAVLQAALRGLERPDQAASSLSQRRATFIPAQVFRGANPGYYFSLGSQGLG